MRCQEVREEFTHYVTGEIEEAARSLISEHLTACAHCRAEAEDLKTLWASLGSIPAAEPGPGLQLRFQMMLESYKQGLEHSAPKGWWAGVNAWLTAWWPRQPAFQLVLALGLLIVGVIVGRQVELRSLRPVAPSSAEVSDLRNELLQMRQMVALSLMQQQSASERLKGVNWSYQLQPAGSEVLEALLSTLMHDANVNVRLATVDALRRFGDQKVVRQGVVEAIPREESPVVQVALIDLAVDLRERESIPTLRQLVGERELDAAVRERAQKGLTELE
jgi:hypothetical protein